MRRLTLKELKEMKTITRGQFCDLKYQDNTTRVWLSRMTIADGETMDDRVCVKELRGGKWEETQTYKAIDFIMEYFYCYNCKKVNTSTIFTIKLSDVRKSRSLSPTQILKHKSEFNPQCLCGGTLKRVYFEDDDLKLLSLSQTIIFYYAKKGRVLRNPHETRRILSNMRELLDQRIIDLTIIKRENPKSTQKIIRELFKGQIDVLDKLCYP